MFDHAEIFRVEDIGTPVIFGDGHILSGTGFFRQRVFPAAGMRAHAAVAAAVGQKTGEQRPE